MDENIFADNDFIVNNFLQKMDLILIFEDFVISFYNSHKKKEINGQSIK